MTRRIAIVASLVVAAPLVGFSTVTSAWAHLGVDEQIVVLDKLIEARPTDASLYLRRGELHRIHQDWTLAEKDYLHSLKLDPELLAARYCLGRMKLEAGEPQQAREHLDSYVKARPNDPAARTIRGRILVELGQPLAAANDFTVALANAREGTSRPEIYLERARALITAGPDNLDKALAGLDEGLEALGEPVTLQLYALELEMGARRFDAALRRIDRLAAQSSRKEPWLMRRGAILEAAGRKSEAMESYRAALTALDTLPASRRNNNAVRRLETEAQAAIARLQGDGTVER
jgi:tetratricopeptide (TPR) repeat protein